MNTQPNHNFTPEDQQLLDRLVDGELSAAERRALLERLEREPGGWRHCALAFLEAQTWQREMHGLLREPAAPVASADKARATRPASWWNVRSLGTLVAMAASLLIAFGLGTGLTHWNSRGRSTEPVDFAMTTGSPSSATARSLSDPRPANAPGNVTLVVDGANGTPASRVQVPVVDQRLTDPAWLMNRPSAVPSDVLQALQRMGNQVHQQRELLPFRMDDGRELLVPVDRVDVQPVNARNYQ